jgi:hypothetical protein
MSPQRHGGHGVSTEEKNLSAFLRALCGSVV